MAFSLKVGSFWRFCHGFFFISNHFEVATWVIQHDYSANEPQDPMVYFGMFYREIKEETAKDIQSKSKEPS